MKNARNWYLTVWLACPSSPQVLERVVEYTPPPQVTYQPSADCSRTSFQIHAAACSQNLYKCKQ